MGALFWLAIIAIATAVSSCAAAPDDVRLHYGHTFQQTGEVGFHPPFDNDIGDSDFVGISFGWQLQPYETVDTGAYVPTEWGDRWVPPVDTTPPEVDDAAPDHVERFDALGTTTKICLLIAVCWLGWVYRYQLAKLIPNRSK